MHLVSAKDEPEVLSFDGSRLLVKRSSETELVEKSHRFAQEKSDLAVWVNRAHQRSIVEAQNVIQSLVQTSGMIAFSALPPIYFATEGETFLWPDQWAAYFAMHQFVLVDLFRDVLCRFINVPESLAANLILFVHQDVLSAHPEWHDHVCKTARRQVHPHLIARHSAISTAHQEADSLSSYILEKWKTLPPLRASISVAIPFHREGHLAHRTLNGLALMYAQAEKSGLEVEVLCTLDNADDITMQTVTQHPFVKVKAKVLIFDHGDLSCTRNQAVEVAKGDYMATLDGDDLYSPNWLVSAFARCRQFTLPAIVHPAKIVSFGTLNGILDVIDTHSTPVENYSPLTVNSWAVTVLAPRLVFQSIPYARPDVKHTGLGYEDWHWHCETLAAGIPHVVAPETALFYRRKVNSMVVEHSLHDAIIRPTAFAKSPHVANPYRASL